LIGNSVFTLRKSFDTIEIDYLARIRINEANKSKFEWIASNPMVFSLNNNLKIRIIMDKTNKSSEELIKEMDDLRQTIEELRKSEEKFRKAYMTSPDSVNISRLSDGLYVSINEGFTKVTGYNEEETIGKTSLEMNIWYDSADRNKFIKELLSKSEIKNYESRFLAKDGTILYGLIGATIIDLDGVPHILAVIRDITLRKQSEEAFRNLSLRQEAILTAVPGILMEVNLDKIYTWTNRSGIEFFGNDVIGKEASFYFEGEQETYNLVQPLFDGNNELFYLESWQRRHDGEKRLLAWWCQSLKDNEGNVKGVLSSARDITEQKKSEEQLFLLANALKSINEAVSITDMDDRVLFLNKAFLDTYGFTESDLRQEPIGVIRSTNNPPEIVKEILPATLRGGWSGELLNRKKDGTEFPVLLSTAVVKNSRGEATAMIGVANDISESRKTQQSLQHSEERFRSVTESASDAIITIDGEENIIGWNRGAEKLFGYKEQEIRGKSLNLLIHSEYRDQQFRVIELLKQGGGKYLKGKTVEVGGLRKNGLVFPVELSFSAWKTSEGQFYTGILRDITKRKRTELENQVIYEITQGVAATSHLDELLKLIHQSLGKVVYAENCFVALHDPKTGLFSFPYFIDKFDQKPEPTSMGKSCTNYVFRTVEPLLLTQEIFDRLIKQNEVELVGSPSPSWIGIPLQTPSKVIGSLVLQHYEKEYVYSESDVKFLSSIGSQIAISIERKKSEEEIIVKNELLQAANAEKDKFFSILAHDLRGPLSAFVAATQILTEQIQTMEKEEIMDISMSMKSSATNIYTLLENLLEWSRLRRGGMDFIPEKLNLIEKIGDCVDVLSESARKKKIEILISIPSDLWILADNHMFDTVIRNLVSNAIKFTPAGGKVNVKAEKRSDNSVEIKIKDSGIGMTPELKDKLFKINEKTSRPGTEGEASTGLGLLLCKEFIDKHGGKIYVESETGKGSTFSFIIPEKIVYKL
jgi:PAS domain S-box-containing protein